MKYRTIAEYQSEIARVQANIDDCASEYLRSDLGKYKKRLQKEMRKLKGARK